MVQQILALLEGLLPSLQVQEEEEEEARYRKRGNREEESDEDEGTDEAEEEIDLNAVDHEQLFIFCLMWSIGALLENPVCKGSTCLVLRISLSHLHIPQGKTTYISTSIQ